MARRGSWKRRAVVVAVVVALVVGASVAGYALVVKSEAFRGRPMLECHRMVYAAIAPLMAGDSAPVHAIDTLKTIAG